MMLQQDAFYSRFQMPTRSGFRGRSTHRGRTNSFHRNTSGGQNSAPNHTPGNHNTNFNRGPNHRSHAPTTFQGIRTNTYGNGSCNECGSRDHWADWCEIRQLKNKIRDLEISAPTWKKKDWANSTEDHPAGETSNDAALAQVFEVCAAEIKSQREPDDCFIDSGASAHVTSDRNLISDVRNAPQSNVTTAGGRVLPVMGQGSTNLDLNKEIQRILYIPGMYKNLLSVGKFADDGHYTLFGPKKCWIFAKHNPNQVILTRTRSHSNSLYRLNTSLQGRTSSPTTANATANILQTAPSPTKLWHGRTGHLNYQSLYHLSKRDMVTGLPPLPLLKTTCEPCILGKQHRTAIPKTSEIPISEILQLVHSDLCGPLPQKSMTGSRYILTFIDHFSRYSWVYFLNTKSETFEVFKQWRAQVEKETYKKLSCLRMDRGGEYLSSEFQHYCKLHGILRQLTTAGTPQQNGMVERKNRYLLETTRSLLFGAHMPTYLWEEAVKTACYLSNRVPTRALYRITPFEVYTSQHPNLAHLRVFGSAAFIHVQDRKKLDPKSRQLVFVGYDLQTKGYRCLDFLAKKIVISRDVIFNENKLGIPNMRELPSSADDILKAFFDLNTPIPVVSSSLVLNPTPAIEMHTQPTSEFPLVSPSDSPNPSYPFPPEPDRHPDLHPETQTDSSGLRRSSRFRRQNVRLDDYVLSISVDEFDLCLAEVAPPLSGNNLTFDQAAHHQGLKEAMEDEMNSILKNHTWDLVSLPIGKKAISSKWVYKTKPGLNGENDRLKARLVARGFEQQYGVDFEETFAPVVKWSTIRALTARAAQLGHAIHHLDVKTAFLYGKITDDIYMAQPLRFTVPGKENLVCKMNCALYGLRQSPHMWYERIDTYLRSLGLTRSSNDYNMYYLGTGPNKVVLVLYVDDLFLSGGNEQKISWLKEQLHTQFDMTDLGSVSKYLGVEFRRLTDGNYHLTQQSYAEDILKEFGMLQSKPEHVPLPPGLQLMSDMNSELADLHHYCKLVGKLIFLTTTRPDLSYAVSIVSRYMSAPQQAHLEVVKHIL
jgi:transposase InsO family protein